MRQIPLQWDKKELKLEQSKSLQSDGFNMSNP